MENELEDDGIDNELSDLLSHALSTIKMLRSREEQAYCPQGQSHQGETYRKLRHAYRVAGDNLARIVVDLVSAKWEKKNNPK